MRRMVSRTWLTEAHLADAGRLRAVLNAHGIEGTDEQICHAYADWSDDNYAAGWMSLGTDPEHDHEALRGFVGYVEHHWLAPDTGKEDASNG